MQVNFFVLDGAPESFGEDIVSRTAAPIHADFDLFPLQAFQIFRAGKVTTLIAVPDFGLGLEQGVVHGGEHEIHLQCLAEGPAEDIAGIPIQHGSEIQPAMRQADVGNINAPNVITDI